MGRLPVVTPISWRQRAPSHGPRSARSTVLKHWELLHVSDAALPTSGRLAGIDYGTSRIGIALCDARQSMASPYENYQRRGERQDAERFRLLAAEETIVGFVVGLPVHVDGRESQKSAEARRFADWLRLTTGLPVTLFDERFTTREAQQLMDGLSLSKKQRKARLDMLAAQILLAGWLERGAGQPQSPQPLEDQP